MKSDVFWNWDNVLSDEMIEIGHPRARQIGGIEATVLLLIFWERNHTEIQYGVIEKYDFLYGEASWVFKLLKLLNNLETLTLEACTTFC